MVCTTRTSYKFTPPPFPNVLGWLLHKSCLPEAVQGQRVFYCHHFSVIRFDRPKNSLAPSYHGVRRLLGWLRCQIIKQRPHKVNPPTITQFFDGLNSLAQTKEPTVVRAILTSCPCNGPMVNCGAKTLYRRCPTHGERGQSCWRVGRRSSFCCCVFVLFCVCRVVFCLHILLFLFSSETTCRNRPG